MEIEEFINRYQEGLDRLGGMAVADSRLGYERLCESFQLRSSAIACDVTEIAGVPVTRLWARDGVGRGDGVVVYVHGGGWSLGSSCSHRGVAEALVLALGREVVSVDYRLLPEANYREALVDVLGVWRTCDPVAAVGDSAGGRLVMDAAATLTREGVGVPPLGLIYPVVGTPHMTTLGPDAPLLTRDDVMALWRSVAADIPCHDVSLPPSPYVHVLAAEHDPLTAMTADAVERWSGTSAHVSLDIAEGMVHSALHGLPWLRPMQAAWRTFCSRLNASLEAAASHDGSE